MDPAIRAKRLAIARQRVSVAALALAERYGLAGEVAALAAADQMPVAARDVYQIEATADLLDALVASENAAAGESTVASELAALPSVGPALAEKLADAGITNLVALRAASDDDLLAIDGVGRATVRRIRDDVGYPTE